MGKGGQGNKGGPKYLTWEEIKKHSIRTDRWIVIDGEVYDVTRWSDKHPGGSRLLGHYSGQDATEPFIAFHNDLSHPKKFLKALHVGTLALSEKQTKDIVEDFEELRKKAEKMGLFQPSYFFFAVVLLHVLILEALSYLNLWYYGTGWIPWIVSVVLYSTVQAQVGWLQHDFGHLSVFKNSKIDHVLHQFTMGLIKGASAHWWNHMHYQHHAKPNVMGKDPDVRLEELFVVGENMPVKIAKKKKNSMPYNLQHKYFFVIGPPLLFPVYFQIMLFRHIFTRRKWLDLFTVSLFFAKLFYLYTPLLGIGGTILFYFTVRCVESHWFTWVTQSNHIPMEIDEDKEEPWVPLQMHATCDVEQSFFNDWFTGHLNFQIEHHLFPTMPRHNYYKVQPMVKELCKKHGIKHEVKKLSTAFIDIVRTLKHSGELWYATYSAFHSD